MTVESKNSLDESTSPANSSSDVNNHEMDNIMSTQHNMTKPCGCGKKEGCILCF